MGVGCRLFFSGPCRSLGLHMQQRQSGLAQGEVWSRSELGKWSWHVQPCLQMLLGYRPKAEEVVLYSGVMGRLGSRIAPPHCYNASQ